MSDPIESIEERLGKHDSASPDGTHTNINTSTFVNAEKDLEGFKARSAKKPGCVAGFVARVVNEGGR